LGKEGFSKRESVGKLTSLLGAFHRKMNHVFQGGGILTVELRSLWLEQEFQELEFCVNFYTTIGAVFIDWLCSKTYIETKLSLKKFKNKKEIEIERSFEGEVLLGSSGQIHPACKLENCITMVETIKKYKISKK